MERSDALKQLQEHLMQLKQNISGLTLSKSSGTPGAPFPIRAAAEVSAVPEAERYDVSGFLLTVQLQQGVLGPAEPNDNVNSTGLLDAVSVEVSSPELPTKLRQAVAAELKRLWAASAPAPGALNLPALWAEASRRFLHLVTLLPEVLEPYQCEDAQGSTVRRWAVLSDEATVTVDASVRPRPGPAEGVVQPAAPAGQTPAVLSGAVAEGAQHRQQQQKERQQEQLRGHKQREEWPGALPQALQQELAFLGRRYGLQQLPPAEAAAAQLAGMLLSNASSAASTPAASQAAGKAPSASQAPAVAFELALTPTDPAWQPGSHPPQLLLQGWATSAYPQAGSLAVIVSPQQPQLGQLPREVLDRLLAAEVAAATAAPAVAKPGGPASVLSTVVRQAANHAGRLWEQAVDIAAEVARRRQLQAGQQGGAPWGAAASAGSDSSLGLDDDGGYAGSSCWSSCGSDGGSSGDEEGSEGEAAVPDEGRGQPGCDGAAGGGHSEATLPLQLQLEGLELVDCDCLEVLRLNLQVSCGRCRATGELSFASAAVALPSEAPGAAASGAAARRGTLAATGECPACHAAWAVELAPKLVHERSNTLAQLRANGCAPLDLLPSMLAGQCGQCSSSAAFRAAAVGRWNERACGSCHAAMRFQFSTAMFVATQSSGRLGGRAAEGGIVAARAAQQRRKASSPAGGADGPFNSVLQLGLPLPDRGTCRHYRHSYRWLRFPCCGRRFPCDICHEELTDGHDMKWATRMVCGYCSLEQSVAGQCKGCGRKLATTAAAPAGRQTRFWEGGRGQRDPSRLHPNDPRRFRGRNKTQSAKHKRVGQKAKERREQA